MAQQSRVTRAMYRMRDVIKSQVRHQIHSAASFEFTCAQPAAQDRNLGLHHFLISLTWITSLLYGRISR